MIKRDYQSFLLLVVGVCILLTDLCVCPPPPQLPGVPPLLATRVWWCSGTTVAATRIEALPSQTLGTGPCPASPNPHPRRPSLSPRPWSCSERQSLGFHLKTPSRNQSRPPNPNYGPWLRSPHLQIKLKEATRPHRAEGRGNGSPPPTLHPSLGPCSPTPCPDTCITPLLSCTDTPAMAPWGPCTAARTWPRRHI